MAAASTGQEEAMTVRTLTELRLANNELKELMKLSEKHAANLAATVNSGTAFVAKLSSLSNKAGDDLGQGMATLSEAFRKIESKRQMYIKTFNEHFCGPFKERLDQEKHQIELFDKESNVANKKMRQEVARLEKQSKSAGKKGGRILKDALDALNRGVKEQETLKSDQLMYILLIKRARYCHLMQDLLKIMHCLADQANETSEQLTEHLAHWTEVATSLDRVPEEQKAYLRRTKEQRTLHNLQSDETDFEALRSATIRGKNYRSASYAVEGTTPSSPIPSSALSPRFSGPTVGANGASGASGGYGGALSTSPPAAPPPPPGPSSSSNGNNFPPPMPGVLASTGAGAGGGGGSASLPPPPPMPGGGGGGVGPPPPPPAGGPPPPGPGSFYGGTAPFASSPPPPPTSTPAAAAAQDTSFSSDYICRCRALYDLEAEQEGDLAFFVGDIIDVISKDPTSDWWTGVCNGSTGIFPSNYVTEI